MRPATFEESDAFRIVPGADVFELRRLRMLDGLPVAVDRSVVPLARAPRLPDVDFATASLYETLEAAGSRPARADYVVAARTVEPREARLLDVERGAAVLVAGTRAYDAGDALLEIAATVYRGDRYRFHASLWRGTWGP